MSNHYFSQALWQPDPTRPGQSNSLPFDEYGFHQRVWALFPGQRQARPFLYHRYRIQGGHGFYIVSSKAPQELENWSIRTKPYDLAVATGEQLAFKLRVNPTVSLSLDGRGRGKRHSILVHARKADEQGDQNAEQFRRSLLQSWLDKRQQRFGFEVVASSLSVAPDQKVSMRKGTGQKPIVIHTVDIEGLLTVTDPIAFQKAALNGIGSGKSFGCGLMMVRRPM